MDFSAYQKRLLTRLEDISAERARSKSARSVVELDQQAVGRLSRMDAIQQQSMALATERNRQSEERKIRAALKRMEEGEYGYCTECGEEIPPDRLKADPTMPRCLSCTLG